MKRLLMEFLGTFFLVFIVAMTSNPFAIAAILMSWIYIGCYISGAHYNPAVSLAVALRGGLCWDLLPRYMVAQIVGGSAAYALVHFIHGSIVIPHPGAGVSVLHAFIIEVLLSFAFALAVLVVATAVPFRETRIAGFVVGFTVPALVIVGSPLSGGLFNPAIAAGATLFGVFKGMPVVWDLFFMYVGGALLGGALAAYVFRYFYMIDEPFGCL
jgi:aquaporin Z